MNWESYETEHGYIRARVRLVGTADGGRSTPIFADGYRPSWDLGHRMPSGELTLNDAAVTLIDVEVLQPGGVANARLHPLWPAAWLDVGPGTELPMHEGARVVGGAEIVMNKLIVPTFSYVGDSHAAERTDLEPPSAPLETLAELKAVLASLEDHGLQARDEVCTYVVDERCRLRVAPRRSEHVVCAGGGPVLGAGEIRFVEGAAGLEVATLTNQSTGFCPDFTSMDAVAMALFRLGIMAYPRKFTTEFVFRLCEACGERNIVKDGWFVCAICDAELPTDYNFPRSE